MQVTSDANTGAPPPGTNGALPSSGMQECPVCQLRRVPDLFPKMTTCRHRSCVDCLRRYLLSQISVSRVDISCPECPVPLDPSVIRRVLPAADWAKYEEFARRRRLASDPDCRWCPAPDCGYAVIARDARGSNPKIVCGREGCGTEFCYRCRQRWHPGQKCATAAAAARVWWDRRRRRGEADDARPCPRCATRISKEGGCDRMTCAVCSCQFCWRCMELWSGHWSGCAPYVPKKSRIWRILDWTYTVVYYSLVFICFIPLAIIRAIFALPILLAVGVGKLIHDKIKEKRSAKRLNAPKI